ncbi:hypothetical protein BL808_001297 [Escherichia coli]|nr:hypothetical protein [Escherichia coli]EHD2019971.1 hypothetical protein [Escherichia coli]
MTVNLDVVIKSGNLPVDMEYGLDTLAGAAEVTCILAEAILRKKIVKRRTPTNPARTELKQSFKSSYGQNFALVIDDPVLKRKLADMTNSVFTEIMSYYIAEALYVVPKALSNKASDYMKDLEEIEDEIINRIRNPLKRMHTINYHRNWDIEFNYKNPQGKNSIVNLNTRTGTNLIYTKTIQARFQIIAVITRFNSRTGNGRLVLKGEDETVAFGFYLPLNLLPPKQKQLISLNLHNNNGKADNFTFLKLVVSRVVIKNGETVKYLVHSAEQV